MTQKMKTTAAAAKEHHPVLAALIDIMPDPKDGWSETEQYNWLRMFAFGMQVAYGGEIAECLRDRPPAIAEPAKLAGGLVPVDTRPAKFHIDQSGFVRNTKTGMAVNLEDVDTDEIFDMRGPKSNLDAVTWANGETGTAGFEGVITS
jgi:hypothetical protein